MVEVYRLKGDFPARLDYRDGLCALEIVREPDRIAYPWVFRARRLNGSRATCELACDVSPARLRHTLQVEGFACEPRSPAKRVMERLVREGWADRYYRRGR